MKRKMKKAAAFALLAGALTAANSMTAFAGAWQKDSKGWWYQKDDGSYYKNEWQWIDGNHDGVSECYCFDADGYMMSNTRIDFFHGINADGAWTSLGDGYDAGIEDQYFVTFTPVKAKDNGMIPDYSGTYIGDKKEASMQRKRPPRVFTLRGLFLSCKNQKIHPHHNCQKSHIRHRKPPEIRAFLLRAGTGDGFVGDKACHGCDQGAETTEVGAD